MPCTSVVSPYKKLEKLYGESDFARHYVKAKTHAQVLHPAPRIPYLHRILRQRSKKIQKCGQQYTLLCYESTVA